MTERFQVRAADHQEAALWLLCNPAPQWLAP